MLNPKLLFIIAAVWIVVWIMRQILSGNQIVKHSRGGGVTITRPKYGEKRKCGGFLWIPKTLNGETRWLQNSEWREKSIGFGWDGECWEEEGKRRDKNYADNMERARRGRSTKTNYDKTVVYNVCPYCGRKKCNCGAISR